MRMIILVILISMNLYSQVGWYRVKSGEGYESIMFVDSLYGWVAGRNGVILSTTDGGMNWKQNTSSTTNYLNTIFFINRNIGWAVGNFGTVLSTTNGGAEWKTKILSPGTTKTFGPVYFTDAFNGWIGTDSGIIFKTTNGGVDWIKYKINELGYIGALYFNNKDTGWASNGKAMWRTTDGGVSWGKNFEITGVFQIIFPTLYCGWALRYHGPDPNLTIVYKTIDGGNKWEIKYGYTIGSSGLYSMSAIDTTHLWACGQAHFSNTVDGGKSWIRNNIGGDEYFKSIYFIDKKNGWAAGNRSIYKTIDGGTVSVELEGGGVPTYYELSQNYPNPFNPVTAITYQIPKEGLVTLKIYDLLGKEVTTLLNEEKQAGKYSIEFNASKLSSGVYLYELRSNEYKSTKKLLLIK
ncbi:MAG TPA: YCF48-related protein [Ignavibacteriaceae bacterium]|nr:YCF48-related protein [Ignavibacteriaceae bacterium]